MCILIIVNDENSQTVILIFHHHIHRLALVTHLTFLIAWHLEEEKIVFHTQLTHHQICIEAQRYDSNLSTLSGKADFCYDMQHHHDQTESPRRSFQHLKEKQNFCHLLWLIVITVRLNLPWLSIYWYGNSRVFCSLSSRPAWIWR